ncbi:TolC family protein [Desulfogranum mediterraneum]|uniref:TolC family protein n=1 Tax=Desulfogranum mediterraneum TaxID=160661 RepID=UPI001E5AF65C|nr:TolC family protein [Desulfogranum mediterraneum]
MSARPTLMTLLSLGLLLFTAHQATGTTAGPSTLPSHWTTQEAVRFALDHSPDAKAALHRIQAAQADIQRARAAFYPQLKLQGGYGSTNNPMYSFGNILNQGVFNNRMDFNDPGVTDNLQLKAELSYRLYNGGRDQAALDRATAGRQAADFRKQGIRSTLSLAVIRAFFTIIQAEETVQARTGAVTSLAAAIKAAQARFEAGDLLKEELLNLEVQHALTREDLIQARHGLALARRGFFNLLGLNETRGELDLAGSRPQPVPERPDFHNRAEIKQMQARLEALEAAVRQFQAGYYPTADAFGSYQLDKGFELDQGSGNSWLAGIQINYALFNGHRTRAEVEQAQAQLTEAREQLRKLELAYSLELEQARLSLEQAEKRIQVTSKMVESAQESARLSRARFKEGLLLSSELIDIENRLTDARVRHALANADHKIAIADLRRAGGLKQFPQTP